MSMYYGKISLISSHIDSNSSETLRDRGGDLAAFTMLMVYGCFPEVKTEVHVASVTGDWH